MLRSFLHSPTLHPYRGLAFHMIRAAQSLIPEGALYSPEELHTRLGPESALVLHWQNPPFWFPAEQLETPLLWIAGEKDAVITTKGLQSCADRYGSDYLCVPEAGHNLMMEKSWRETARSIDEWLTGRHVS